MRVTGPGRILFALSFAALGALTIGFHGFALAWPPVPNWLPRHGPLVALSGAILLASGIALLMPRAARPAALALAGFLFFQLTLLHAPHIAAHPLVEGMWESMSETLAELAGAWTIFSMLPRKGSALARFGNVRAGQVLFALALPAIGLSHMIYLDETAPLIPAWLPYHVPLAYLTGAAHIAAGVGILFGVLPRLAATLEAVMLSSFTLIVWVPMVARAPARLPDWSELCVSAAISGAAWAVAESLRGQAWFSRR